MHESARSKPARLPHFRAGQPAEFPLVTLARVTTESALDLGHYRADFLAVLTQELAGDIVGKQFRRLIDGESIASIIQAHAGTMVRRILAKSLRKSQPPRRTAIVIVVVQQLENIIAGKSEERIAIEESRLRLEKRIRTETVLVDFEHQLSVATIGQNGSGSQARVHALTKTGTDSIASVRLNTIVSVPGDTA
jgi:hypothetical protein